jgi:hypothetical protein
MISITTAMQQRAEDAEKQQPKLERRERMQP